LGKNILIVASGPSAKQYQNFNYLENGYTVICVNHGWMATGQHDWEVLMTSSDFYGELPQYSLKDHQKIRTDYDLALNKYGGHAECGLSIVLATSYWCLNEYEPSLIGYLGCDMNYTPDANGHTHIYGVGLDIIKYNGQSDPDRMAERKMKDDPNYLENIYKRFEHHANLAKCQVYNFASIEKTRLPYIQMAPERSS
jgi:hypothetical protein